MNLPRRSPASPGFTLVELLVVIAIIAILASVISVAAGSAIAAAKRAKASNTATQLQTAVVNYYTEYGVYPLPANPPASDVLYTYNDETDWAPLAFALCGNINAGASTVSQGTSGTVPNTRNIAFFTPKKSEVDTNGIPINPFSTTAAPVYFFIAIDADYSGILGDTGGGNIPDFTQWKSPAAESSAAGVKLTTGVAVWGCCDPQNLTNPGASTSPNLWVKTY